MPRETHRLRRNCILAECRKRVWPLAELARQAKIDPSTISLVVVRGRRAESRTITKIATALKVEARYLVLKKGQPDCPRDAKESTLPTIIIRDNPEFPPSAADTIDKLISGLENAFAIKIKYEIISEGNSLILTTSMHQWHLATLLGAFIREGIRLDKKHGHPYPVDVKGFIFNSEDITMPYRAYGPFETTFYRECRVAAKKQPDRFFVDLDRYGMLTFVEITAPEKSPVLAGT
jgi:lambda repressor-like predicted transcriptional regulator